MSKCKRDECSEIELERDELRAEVERLKAIFAAALKIYDHAFPDRPFDVCPPTCFVCGKNELIVKLFRKEHCTRGSSEK